MNRQRLLMRINTEYKTLVESMSNGINLSNLLTLSQDIKGFEPYISANNVEKDVEIFAQKHGIWIEDRGVHYNTMTAYLHPSTVDDHRLYLLGCYYAILFFIDDVMGNEFRSDMTSEEQYRADYEMDILMNFLQIGKKSEQPSKLLAPVVEILEGFAKLAQAKWLDHFLQFTQEHLSLAVDDLNSTSLGHITPEKYTELRNHVSGMYPAILMMEFASNTYLPRVELQGTGLLRDIKRLEYLCAAIGGLVNDFFSFEKEVLDAQSDFNIIPVMMMHENLSLEEAIHKAAVYTNNLYSEYKCVAKDVREQINRSPWSESVQNHINAMDLCNQAVWVWQVDTDRYNRQLSIFHELRDIEPNYQRLKRLAVLSS